MQRLSNRRDIVIENYKEIRLPTNIGVDNRANPFLFQKKQSNREAEVNLGAVTALKGAKKIEIPNNPSQINEFFVFAEMPNKGEL